MAPRSVRMTARGMTLIEILVASMLAVMLGMITYGVVTTTTDTQQSALFLQTRLNASRVGIDRMRRELTMAFVSLHQAEDKRTQTLFLGESDKIVFNTGAHEPLTKDSRTSDQLEVEYKLARVTRVEDPNEYTQALVRRVKYHIDDQPGDGGIEEVIVEDVKDFELEYFDKYREDWTDEWDVTVEDAIEMRQRLKELQQLREQVEGIAEDEQTGVAGVELGAQAEEVIDEQELELLDGMVLPSRVRIRLVLQDPDGYEFPIQSQVEITMTEPLWY